MPSPPLADRRARLPATSPGFARSLCSGFSLHGATAPGGAQTVPLHDQHDVCGAQVRIPDQLDPRHENFTSSLRRIAGAAIARDGG